MRFLKKKNKSLKDVVYCKKCNTELVTNNKKGLCVNCYLKDKDKKKGIVAGIIAGGLGIFGLANKVPDAIKGQAKNIVVGAVKQVFKK